MATATGTRKVSAPKSGAISKGHNFASTWEQNAPLTEEQQAVIVALSHAMAERPLPTNLGVKRRKKKYLDGKMVFLLQQNTVQQRIQGSLRPF